MEEIDYILCYVIADINKKIDKGLKKQKDAQSIKYDLLSKVR